MTESSMGKVLQTECKECLVKEGIPNLGIWLGDRGKQKEMGIGRNGNRKLPVCHF